MIPTFKLKARAKDDLKAIAVFTQKRWGRNQRNKYLHQFDDSFHQLADNPNLGSACDYIRPGYRKFPVISHVIYYRISGTECVEIIRILHKHMDVSSKLFEA
ncbi:type II toxin-antitoxin system RelE/ParE family toxin [Candidatus Thiodiazotropha endoloripes]|uniref:type II toxin-antitoxin system RelE/ParE family toxin n=1 Tax=Candidatus Thiodiazotropha endoloripes TaxID=1818881 RepID=UPI0027398FD6|nr:type II toxin-antitoxin system RelE/ParE family toxin [Candidatus Thiodiazotropha endoloripes]